MGSIYDKHQLGEETITWFDKFKTDLDLLRIRTSGYWSGEGVPKDFIVNFIEAVDRDIDYLYRVDLKILFQCLCFTKKNTMELPSLSMVRK